MPYSVNPIGPFGPLIDLLVNLSLPRLQVIQAAKQTIPPHTRCRGLIDTGASATGIDPTLAKQLNLVPTGKVPIHTPSTAGGAPHMANEYDMSLIVPLGKTPQDNMVSAIMCQPFQSFRVVETNLLNQGGGFLMLVGRDILNRFCMTYDGRHASYILAI